MKPQVIQIHPTGNQFFLNTALAFHEVDALHSLFTCVASCDDNLYAKLSKLPWLGEIGRREYPAELKNFLRQKPTRELFRLLAKRLGWRGLYGNVDSPLSVDQVYWKLDEAVATFIHKNAKSFTQGGIVYAYDDGALKSFETAKSTGMRTVLDLPIVYWETMHALLVEEAERYPDWAPTLLGDNMPKLKTDRKTRELELADQVICPSEFVKRTLPTSILSNKKVDVIPFGSPSITIQETGSEQTKDGVFRLLFAGGMSQRKGLADVFEAMRLLDSKSVELHIIGDAMMGLGFYQKRFSGFVYHGTMPHDEVLKRMQQCDALVLPSIVEGRAQVQQEAMACGLPVIASPNAGAEDLIEEGITGHLVPIRSPEKIAEAVDKLISNSSTCMEISEACRKKAEENTWSNYRKRMQNVTLGIP